MKFQITQIEFDSTDEPDSESQDEIYDADLKHNNSRKHYVPSRMSQ